MYSSYRIATRGSVLVCSWWGVRKQIEQRNGTAFDEKKREDPKKNDATIDDGRDPGHAPFKSAPIM